MIIFFALLGLVVGSFLGLCFWRIPNNESVIYPRSYCPNCNSKIKYFDNIPLISWIILKGRCRYCSSNISLRYPLIEISTTILWLSAYFSSPNNLYSGNTLFITIGGGIFFSYLLILSLLDAKYFWLPQSLCFQGIVIGLIFHFIYSFVLINPPKTSIFFDSLITSIFGLIIVEILCLSLKKIFGKELLGRGDAKLIALGSAWLGMQGILVATCISFWIASLFGIIGRLTNRLKPFQYIPFGPFLSIGFAIVWIIGGNRLWQYWENIIL